jgi:hypothetical protein
MAEQKRKFGFETRMLHAGHIPDPVTGASRSLLPLVRWRGMSSRSASVWLRLRRELLHLHDFVDDWPGLQAAVQHWLAQWQWGSPDLLHFVVYYRIDLLMCIITPLRMRVISAKMGDGYLREIRMQKRFGAVWQWQQGRVIVADAILIPIKRRGVVDPAAITITQSDDLTLKLFVVRPLI